MKKPGITDSFLLKDVLKKNEVHANRYSERIVIFLFLFYVVIAVLNYLGLYERDVPDNYQIYFALASILGVGVLAGRFIPSSAQKWVLFVAFILSNAVCRCFFYVFSTLIYTIPIFLSVAYYNKKFTWRISIVAWCFFLATVAFARNTHLASHSIEFILFASALPQTIVLLLSALVCTRIAGLGRVLVVKQSKNAQKISQMEQEIALSAHIQSNALPLPEYATANGEMSLKAAMIPAKEVAGDFYDYFMINDFTLGVLVADVSDKGVPAAMFMMSARNSIRYAAQDAKTVEEAIRIANKLLIQNNDGDMFVTLWLCGIDIRTGLAHYVNAGHLPPILKRANGRIEMIENDPDLFLGVFDSMEPHAYFFQMQKGDQLLLYTDGVTDAENIYGASFGLGHLIQVCRGDRVDVNLLCDGVVKAVHEFREGREIFDDMTVLAVEFHENFVPIYLKMDLPAKQESVSKVIDAINEKLESVDCSEENRKIIDVVIDEICVNIVDYAYDGQDGNMEVEAEIGPNYIKMKFLDSGKEFNPLLVKEPSEDDLLVEGGLGIHLVRNMVGSMEYEYRDGKNCLTILRKNY